MLVDLEVFFLFSWFGLDWVVLFEGWEVGVGDVGSKCSFERCVWSLVMVVLGLMWVVLVYMIVLCFDRFIEFVYVVLK